ncbi:MAG: hypothetical protein CMC83_00675 [Flavobacteriaceae bacterium]|nr:hypothetical protein [Flavobacteriaceae bacterium]
MKQSLIFLILFFYVSFTQAQCSMCRAVLESEAGQKTAEGVNDGIVYLMAIPYILVGGLAIIIYRAYKAKHKN